MTPAASVTLYVVLFLQRLARRFNMSDSSVAAPAITRKKGLGKVKPLLVSPRSLRSRSSLADLCYLCVRDGALRELP
jgi:hypothetical protein